jgi:superfamily II RNA helicase
LSNHVPHQNKSKKKTTPRLLEIMNSLSDLADMEEVFDAFFEWTLELGIELYPAQEEGVMEVMSDHHVILNTPTGSGKSMVALGSHFWAMSQGKRSFYTSPIKALVNEKFFSLCKTFGAENVGMLTGDASINRDAPIICCTQEILSTLALSEGDEGRIDYAVIDEFHYYGDRDRGMAWLLPLITLTKTRFLLMSATLGDTSQVSQSLENRTLIPVSLVSSDERPVPLNFSFSLEPLHETIPDLLKQNRAPIYIVSFTQSGCASIAQSLTSLNLCSKEEKKSIQKAIKGTKLDSPYGADMKRFLLAGVGLHHAGLLPKYRLLVERLAQAGVLKVIVGTDTLGVGINVPIRTVVFNELGKFDGRKNRLLTVRDFKQIAGRAGRKGFDNEGFVVCQAPDWVIENNAIRRKREANPQKAKKYKMKSPPSDRVSWSEATFDKLIISPSETLKPRFKVDFALVINLMQSRIHSEHPDGAYASLEQLIHDTPFSDDEKTELLSEAERIFESLLTAGVIELQEDQVQIAEDLQHDFSMHHSLSLFLIHLLARLPIEEGYEFRVLSIVESILEDPTIVLRRQRDVLVKDKIAELKAEGVEFDERQELIETVTYPMPEAETILATFEEYADQRPWLHASPVSPKSVVREMYESCATFKDYIQLYNLKAAEGIVLRYLNSAYKALLQNVPEVSKTDTLHDMIAYLRATLRRADSSLLEAWMQMRFGSRAVERLQAKVQAESDEMTIERQDLTEDPKAFFARIRAQMRQVVQALSRQDYTEVLLHLRQDNEFKFMENMEDMEGIEILVDSSSTQESSIEESTKEPVEGESSKISQALWTADLIADQMRPFYDEYEAILFNGEARANHNTVITVEAPRKWSVHQVLLDDQADRLWYLQGEINLIDQETPEGPLVRLIAIRAHGL